MGFHFQFRVGFIFVPKPLPSLFFSLSVTRRRGTVHIFESQSSSWVRELLGGVVVAGERAIRSSICIWLPLSMGNGKEHASTLTPCNSNPLSADIPSTCPESPNYMHPYYGEVPAWSPGFMPNAGYPFPHNTETPIEVPCTSSAVEEINEHRPNPQEWDGWITTA
ncbi:uncharacterized protein LOC122302844 [Carya illinoinensis]|uniref:Uncharacterized protein n=1 Tax=Carya illinoinensis TaxID=32201 RepID=A0A922E2D2_CARIL|nr:uncharacterized protein LOC122277155 [Carya illinoinensis]XP_042956840.1 uncharacterized protein LOC122292513 [Carya illinoinensis]XP_042970217.1 uncharacterized protein LOC122302844 [Carya illinoinensis]KAG6694586.1 hypothetical protein I3842_09G055600 [Carya illinoinensis]